MAKDQFKLVFTVFLVTFIGLIFWFLPQNYSSSEKSNNNDAFVSNSVKQEVDFTLKIDSGDGLVRDFNAVAYDGETLFSALKRRLSEENIEFGYKSYAGLGELVTRIGPMKNRDNGKDWRYYVNGVMPQIGVSFYKVRNSDIIEWKFEK